MAIQSTTPLLPPTTTPSANASQATMGAPITPTRRIQTMPPDEWELFVAEWADSLRAKYQEVHRCGGKGDMGRDVVAFKAAVGPRATWDNYQCKHYARSLTIPDVVAELGKLFYYISQGEFSAPDAYYFVAPHGPSTALLNCLHNGTLKQEILNGWNTICRTKITKTLAVALSTVQATIDAFDFSNVFVFSTQRIYTGHQQTRYHAFRFGGGLPARPLPVPQPPNTLQPNETIYVKKLLDAYSDDKKTTLSADTLETSAPEMARHLRRSREHFFSAESLLNFSRDNVPPGTFEQLQGEVFDGVQEVYEDETHPSGYQRVLKTIQQARTLQITGNPLIGVMHTNDRAGICHQLANDDKMTWVRDDKTKEEK